MIGFTFGTKIGFRYLFAKKTSRFLSLITAMSVLGVTLGVFTLIVTLSVMGGFEEELTKRLFSADAHIRISPKNAGGEIAENAELLSLIKRANPAVQSAYPILQSEAIIQAGKKTSGALIRGISDVQLDWLKGLVVEKVAPELVNPDVEGRVFMGSEMAYDLGVIPGDVLTVVSPSESSGPFDSVPKMKKFMVEGIYKSGVPEQELHVLFAPLPHVESFLRRAGRWSEIEVRVHRLEDAPNATQTITQTLHRDDLTVRSWQQLNEHLFSALKLERTAMFSILVFIVIVASFNIISMLTMMVVEKKRSLAILRAIGANPVLIRSIFRSEGLMIGVVGIGLGTFLALSACKFLKTHPLIELPDYFYDRSIPVVINPLYIFAVCLCTFIVVWFASLGPATRASKLTPMEGIRS